jgi:DNA primase
MLSEKLSILSGVFGSYYPSNDEYLFYCPFCHHKNRKLSININSNKYQCWVCGAAGHNIYRLIKKFGSKEQVSKWASLLGQVDLSDPIDLLEEEDTKKEETILELPKEFKFLGNKNLPISSIDAKLYLQERGINRADILKWKIGYCSTGEYEERIIFPSFNLKGDCNFFVARSYKKSGLKYKNPEACKDIIFNELYVDWTKSVSLVEGVFDAVTAGNAVPLLGSSLTEGSELLKKLCQIDLPVYIALDPDAEERKTYKIINMLLQHGLEIRKVPIEPFKDVSECGKLEYQRRMLRAEIMTQDALFEKMISNI